MMAINAVPVVIPDATTLSFDIFGEGIAGVGLPVAVHGRGQIRVQHRMDVADVSATCAGWPPADRSRTPSDPDPKSGKDRGLPRSRPPETPSERGARWGVPR